LPAVSDELSRPALLDVTVDRGATSTTILLAGDLDPATAPTLAAAIDEVVADPTVDALVLDLAGLAFVDSSGLRAFVTAREALADRGTGLVLRNPSPNTRRLLDITGLGEIIAVE